MSYKDKEKQREYNKEYNQKNKEKCNAVYRKWFEDNPDYYKEYHQNHKEKRNAASAAWRKDNPDYMRNWGLVKDFGLTPEDFDELYKKQGGLDPISGEKLPEGRSASVDHDHRFKKGELGYIRGLMISKYNRAAGLLGDDWRKVQALADYLKAHEEKYP